MTDPKLREALEYVMEMAVGFSDYMSGKTKRELAEACDTIRAALVGQTGAEAVAITVEHVARALAKIFDGGHRENWDREYLSGEYPLYVRVMDGTPEGEPLMDAAKTLHAALFAHPAPKPASGPEVECAASCACKRGATNPPPAPASEPASEAGDGVQSMLTPELQAQLDEAVRQWNALPEWLRAASENRMPPSEGGDGWGLRSVTPMAATDNGGRFFVEHGMIHDRETGQHVCTHDDSEPGATQRLFDLIERLAAERDAAMRERAVEVIDQRDRLLSEFIVADNRAKDATERAESAERSLAEARELPERWRQRVRGGYMTADPVIDARTETDYAAYTNCAHDLDVALGTTVQAETARAAGNLARHREAFAPRMWKAGDRFCPATAYTNTCTQGCEGDEVCRLRSQP